MTVLRVIRVPALQGGQGIIRRCRAAKAIVEFAVVAPVFFLLVLGIIEFSRGFMVVHQLTEAARHGCRTGILQGQSNTQIEASVDDYLGRVGIRGTSKSVLVNDVPADASTAQSGDEITVTVTVPVNQVTWLPREMFLKRGNFQGRFTMQRE